MNTVGLSSGNGLGMSWLARQVICAAIVARLGTEAKRLDEPIDEAAREATVGMTLSVLSRITRNPTIGLESVDLAQPRFQVLQRFGVNRAMTHDMLHYSRECSSLHTAGNRLASTTYVPACQPFGRRCVRVLYLSLKETQTA